MERKSHYSGEIYNSWTLIRPSREGSHGHWVCRCKCGVEKEQRIYHVVYGHTKQCKKCYSNSPGHRFAPDGKISPEYRAWSCMITRCTNPNVRNYTTYGGRGIEVAKIFTDEGGFTAFYNHVGPKPSSDHSLDRIDNNLGYMPGNLKWSTDEEQGNNRRNNHILNYQGKEQTVAQWAKELDMDANLLYARLSKGWSVEKVLTAPIRTEETLTVDGTTRTLTEWSEISGIKRATIWDRYSSLGWTAKRAVTQKPQKRRSRNLFNCL